MGVFFDMYYFLELVPIIIEWEPLIAEIWETPQKFHKAWIMGNIFFQMVGITYLIIADD